MWEKVGVSMELLFANETRTQDELATRILTILYEIYAEQEGLEILDLKITRKDKEVS